jgi:hypothetical protein
LEDSVERRPLKNTQQLYFSHLLDAAKTRTRKYILFTGNLIFPQARIQNLVFKMLKRQFETWSGIEPMLWYPECATVQYLLPCFVATFLDMYKDPSANRTQTGKCLSLVHELLLSYEQEPYEQSFTEQWKQPYLYERRKKIAEDMILARNVFLLCTDDKFHGITILPCVAKGFMNLVLHKTMNGEGRWRRRAVPMDRAGVHADLSPAQVYADPRLVQATTQHKFGRGLVRMQIQHSQRAR